MAMVLCGVLGVLFHYKQFEARYMMAFASVAVVGLGSMAFHGTLLFSLQMLDELPMIYASLIMAYIVIEQNHKNPKYYPMLPIGLTIHGILTTLLVASPAFFPTYASPLLQFVCFHISFAILETFLLATIITMFTKEESPEMRKLHIIGTWLWFAGIACWVLDYFGCEHIWEGDHGLRKTYLTFTIGSWTITAPNPQLHAWWHVCASSGLYILSVVVAEFRARKLGHLTQINYYMGFLPYVTYTEQNKTQYNLRTRRSSNAKKLSAEVDEPIAASNEVITNSPQLRRRGRDGLVVTSGV
jgi:dihydroceramidase